MVSNFMISFPTINLDYCINRNFRNSSIYRGIMKLNHKIFIHLFIKISKKLIFSYKTEFSSKLELFYTILFNAHCLCA